MCYHYIAIAAVCQEDIGYLVTAVVVRTAAVSLPMILTSVSSVGGYGILILMLTSGEEGL